MIKVLDNFKEVYYFDHHLNSGDLAYLADEYPHFKYHFDLKMSASAMVYSYWVKEVGGKPTSAISRLVLLTDVFDMWRTKHDYWEKAFWLNDLFWHYNYFQFEKMYVDGFLDFTEEERSLLTNKSVTRIEAIKAAPKEQVSENSSIIMLEDRDPLAIVQFEVPGNLWYMLTMINGQYSGSIRTTSDTYDVNETLGQMVAEFPDIIVSGGGHKKAGGCLFKDGLEIGTIMDFIHEHMDPRMIA